MYPDAVSIGCFELYLWFKISSNPPMQCSPKIGLFAQKRKLAHHRAHAALTSSGMRLLHLRSSWGLRALSANPRAVLHGVRLSGWRGLEASLADLGTTHAERKATVAEAHAAELPLILSAYSSWPNYEGPCVSSRSVREHAAQFGAELCEIAELAAPPGGDAGSPTVLRVNGHSGSDAWTEAEALDYFGEVQHVAASLGASLPPLSHETHRGRYLCCPFATARLLRRAPELRLTSDFSHWVVKCERLLETRPELELLAEIAPAVDHLHARIGTAQAAQVGSVHSPSTRHAAERFYSWWEAVWEARAQAGDELVTATLECPQRPL